MADDTVMSSLNGTSDGPEEHSKSISPAAVLQDKSNNNHYAADPEAQEMVIESLRTQIQDLFTQVTQLNSKLVTSYNRVSDLEDTLHETSAELRTSSIQISQLELERTQHLAALNTGLLVEKHHVTSELNRLMEKATEEAAQRGQAESSRAAIEKELDDLSASLFNQANTMVAEARYARHISERKAEDAERALKGAEEAVSAMQQQVQALQQQKEEAERKTDEMRVLTGKGKWAERVDTQIAAPIIRLLSSHPPYQEFLLFVAHLRQLHPSSLSPPAMSTLLSLPFLQRLSTEDSDPTVRLDLAPSLNWLSRRSVLTAIHTGHLTIEPTSTATLLAEISYLPNASISGINGAGDSSVTCALCGVPIFQPNNTSGTLGRSAGQSHSPSGGSWSTGLFKKNTNNSTASLPASQTLNSHAKRSSIASVYPSQIYIFRISSPQTSAIPSIPLSLKSSSSLNPINATGLSGPSSSNHISPPPSHNVVGTPTNTSSTAYPLCCDGWCLARLRSTCSLWAFVRTGIVEKVWEEEIPPSQPARRSRTTSQNSLISSSLDANSEKPPIPPRRRGFWGLASAIGEKAASWGETKKAVSEDKEKKGEDKEKNLPPPPPRHPQEAAHSDITPTPRDPRSLDQISVPSLPKRSGARARTYSNQLSDPAAAAASETQVTQIGTPLPDNSMPVHSVSAPKEHLVSMAPVARPPSVPPSASSPQPLVTAVPTPPLTPTRPQHSSGAPPPLPQRAAKRLSANLNRPGTPTSVPLPDSRPGTPTVGGGTNPPSRTQSPALPSPIGTGTPPPIPRRAASRARRVIDGSGTITKSGEPRSATPEIRPQAQVEVQSQIANLPGVGGATGISSTAKEEKRTSQSSIQLETVREETKSEVTVRIDGPETAEAPTVSLTASNASKDSVALGASPGSEIDQFVDAAEDLPRPQEKAETGHKDLQETSEIQAGRPEQDAKGKLDPDVQPAVSLNDEDLPPPLPPRKEPRDVKETSTASKEDVSEDNGKYDVVADEASKDKEKEGDWQSYIGDATWEERTWRELTRLREEMFWARVGAIRS